MTTLQSKSVIAMELRLEKRLEWFAVATGGALLVLMVLGLGTIEDWAICSGTLAAINMILLFLGGRTSALAELAGISLPTYYVAQLSVYNLFNGPSNQIIVALMFCKLFLFQSHVRQPRTGIRLPDSAIALYIWSIFYYPCLTSL
jgi:hypothetical protein